MEQVKRSDEEVVAELRQSALELRQWERELPEGADVDREHYHQLLRDLRAAIVERTEPGRSLLDAHSVLDDMGAEDSQDENLAKVYALTERAISATFSVTEMLLDVEGILQDAADANMEQIRGKIHEALALIRGQEGGEDDEH
jgi:hypothetical protein